MEQKIRVWVFFVQPLTQTLTQNEENRRGADRTNLRVLCHFRPKKARKALRRSGWRNQSQRILRRPFVPVRPCSQDKRHGIRRAFCHSFFRPPEAAFCPLVRYRSASAVQTYLGEKHRIPAGIGCFCLIPGPAAGKSGGRALSTFCVRLTVPQSGTGRLQSARGCRRRWGRRHRRSPPP